MIKICWMDEIIGLIVDGELQDIELTRGDSRYSRGKLWLQPSTPQYLFLCFVQGLRIKNESRDPPKFNIGISFSFLSTYIIHIGQDLCGGKISDRLRKMAGVVRILTNKGHGVDSEVHASLEEQAALFASSQFVFDEKEKKRKEQSTLNRSLLILMNKPLIGQFFSQQEG